MSETIYREIWLTENRRIEPIEISENSKMPISLKVMDKTLSGSTAEVYAYNSKLDKYTKNVTDASVANNTVTFAQDAGLLYPGTDYLQIHFPVSGGQIITRKIPVDCQPDFSNGGTTPEAEDVKPLVKRIETVAASIPHDYRDMSKMVDAHEDYLYDNVQMSWALSAGTTTGWTQGTYSGNVGEAFVTSAPGASVSYMRANRRINKDNYPEAYANGTHIVVTPPAGYALKILRINSDGIIQESIGSASDPELNGVSRVLPINDSDEYVLHMGKFNGDAANYASDASFVAQIKLEYKKEMLVRKDEIPSDTEGMFASVAMYQHWAVCGASRECGYIYPNADSPYTETVVNRELSWGKINARKNGNDCSIYAVEGRTSIEWLKNTEWGLSKLLSDDPKQFYAMALGQNDVNHPDRAPLGSTANVHDSLAAYTDADKETTYGAYSFALLSIRNHAPSAHIMCIFRFNKETTDQNAINVWNAVQYIANRFGLPYANWNDSEAHRKYLAPSTYRYGGHPTAQGYALMANVFDEIYSKTVLKYWEYFSHYVG